MLKVTSTTGALLSFLMSLACYLLLTQHVSSGILFFVGSLNLALGIWHLAQLKRLAS